VTSNHSGMTKLNYRSGVRNIEVRKWVNICRFISISLTPPCADQADTKIWNSFARSFVVGMWGIHFDPTGKKRLILFQGCTSFRFTIVYLLFILTNQLTTHVLSCLLHITTSCLSTSIGFVLRMLKRS
jgi:hypothetical protein